MSQKQAIPIVTSLEKTVASVNRQLRALQQLQYGSDDYYQARIRIADYVRSTVSDHLRACNSVTDVFNNLSLEMRRNCDAMTSARSGYGFNHEGAAQWAWRYQVGNCNEHASLVYYLLKRAGAGRDLRIISKDATHLFVVWGVPMGANANNRGTWGPHTLVIDAWKGYVSDPMGLDESYLEAKLYDATAARNATESNNWMINDAYHYTYSCERLESEYATLLSRMATDTPNARQESILLANSLRQAQFRLHCIE